MASCKREETGTWEILGSLSEESMGGQALKGEESQMGHRKSESLVVLGAGERPVHGEAVNGEGVRLSGSHGAHRGFKE